MLLEAKNIHKVYYNGKKSLAVLKGIDLTVRESEFVAIVGPSGAGKSTLLHILGALDRPTQGKVVFAGENIYQLGDREISRLRNTRIGFVFQFYHLLSEFSVLENVLLPAQIHQNHEQLRQSRRHALELLAQVGLVQRTDYFPAQLSGGEKQRVAIVRGLINNPDLVLCDEPTGNLDSSTGEEIVGLLKKIQQENKMSVLLVTHNADLARQADKMLRLKDGILVN